MLLLSTGPGEGFILLLVIAGLLWLASATAYYPPDGRPKKDAPTGPCKCLDTTWNERMGRSEYGWYLGCPYHKSLVTSGKYQPLSPAAHKRNWEWRRRRGQ